MDFIEKLAPFELSRLGGAGNKVNRVALGECDCYIQPRGGLGFWDMCAPEVIIRAMGGLLTDMNKERLCYDINRAKERPGKPILPPFLLGKSIRLHTLILKRLGKL